MMSAVGLCGEMTSVLALPMTTVSAVETTTSSQCAGIAFMEVLKGLSLTDSMANAASSDSVALPELLPETLVSTEALMPTAEQGPAVVALVIADVPVADAQLTDRQTLDAASLVTDSFALPIPASPLPVLAALYAPANTTESKPAHSTIALVSDEADAPRRLINESVEQSASPLKPVNAAPVLNGPVTDGLPAPASAAAPAHHLTPPTVTALPTCISPSAMPASSSQWTVPGHALLDNSAWSSAIADRLTWLGHNGINSASLHITPDELGPIHVHIEMAEEGAKVAFSADHQDTQGLLERMMPKLNAAFEANGLTLNEVRVQAGATQAAQLDLSQSSGGREGAAHQNRAATNAPDRDTSAATESDGVDRIELKPASNPSQLDAYA